MITKQQINDYVLVNLNDVARHLGYDDIEFEVRLDNFNYEWILRNAANTLPVVPCVLELQSSDFSSGTDLRQQEYTYNLNILLKASNVDRIRNIADVYLQKENENGAVMVIGSTTIQKYTPQFVISELEELGGEEINLEDGDAAGSHLVLSISFTWLCTDDVLTSENLIININDYEVPFLTCNIGADKSILIGVEAGTRTPTDARINSMVFLIELILDMSIPPIADLYRTGFGSGINDTNKEYIIGLMLLKPDGTPYAPEYGTIMRLNRIGMSIEKPQLLTLIAEFSTAFKKIDISLSTMDSLELHRLAVLNYSSSLMLASEAAQFLPSDVVVNYATGYVRTFNMQIVIDLTKPPVVQLINAIANPNISNISFIISLTIDNTLQIGQFNVLASQITLEGNTNPLGIIIVNFIERR